MAASESTLLLSKLESPDLTNIHHLFSTYLHPFSAVSTTKKLSDSDLRSLAKKFLPFLNRALSLLPKRLSETPKIDSRFALQLFDIYKLCLSCLASISSQLSCKPYSVHTQTVRLIHCLENWDRYSEALTDGLSVLDSLKVLTKTAKSKGRLVPDVEKGSVDKDLAFLIVEVVVTLVKCVSLGQSKGEGDYRRILVMVDEIQPWFRVVDVNEREKLQRMLATHLSKCALFLAGELSCFDGNLLRKFCSVTFREFAKLPIKDQMFKFARRICSTLFSQPDNLSSSIVDILICVLDSMTSECKPGMEKIIVEYLELVSYCANKSRTANSHVCGAVASYFKKLAGDFCQVYLAPFQLVMRLYAIGLLISDYIRSKPEKNMSLIVSWLNEGETLLKLPLLLGLLTQENDMAFRAEYKNLLSQRRLLPKSNCQSICTLDRRTYMLSYYSALNFLCEPLSEFVNSERKEILAELSAKLSPIQDAFHIFCYLFLSCYSVSDKGCEINDDTIKTVLTVAVATFTLSLTTTENTKESVNFLRHVISADWIQPNGLKFLFASLYNVGVVLYRSNRLKEASKALKLCCKAAWTRVLHLCMMFIAKTKGDHSDLSEDAIQVFVGEACSKSAFLLDVLYQCGSDKTERIIVDFLESWSVAESMFRNLPEPIGLVKHWVRVECKPSMGIGVVHSATLYSLLSFSEKVSKQALGLLLEQKSRILIAKARESVTCGSEGLKDNILYLSHAISTLEVLCGETSSCSLKCYYQLADAYCLRALCSQEADPDSKGLNEDIEKALKIWLSRDYGHLADQNPMAFEHTLILLYYVADLFSMKGYMDLHSDIYEMIIRLFEWKKIPKEKWLARLWQSRRLGHALCASPVDDAFIRILLKHHYKEEEDPQYEVFKSMKFWISCMEISQPLKVGFQQKISFMFNIFSTSSYHHDHAIGSDVTIEEVKQAASNLISRVPSSNSAVFLAACLYYDLGERLISNGLLTEALSYSKEAHRLRGTLFKDNFLCSVEHQNEIVDENGNTIQKSCYSLKNFRMHPSVASLAWSYRSTTNDFEGCILTPWSVLQCYLESILQVATIQETVGNGSEAEALLLWGKNIASFQGLSLFRVAFSSVLGKLYLKQRLSDLAEKELESAKQVLANNCSLISCTKCRLVFEVTIDEQLGDLSRSRFHSSTRNKVDDGLSYAKDAEDVYRSALEKLNSEWGTPFSNPGEASTSSTKNTRSRRLAPQTRSKSVKNGVEIRCGVTDICNKMNCWHCLVLEVMKSGSLNDLVLIKWELVRRRISLRLLAGIGKCFWAQGEIHKAHEIFFESIALLVSKCTKQSPKSSVHFSALLEFIGKDVLGDVLATEHASILYNISWFSLRSSPSKGTRDSCCAMSCESITRIVSWLMLAFTRCREVPVLFQKVSRLLAVIYTLSTSIEAFPMLRSSCNAISESQWASYFHQASLGCHLNHQLFFRNSGKQKSQSSVDFEASCFSTTTSVKPLRPAPELLQDLEGFVLNFFQGLPCVTIICISLLGDHYVSLVKELLHYPSPVYAWILVSRFNGNGQPVVILLPVVSIIEESSDDNKSSSSADLCEGLSSVRQWHCPWGYTMIDDVAPVFKQILKNNYLSSSTYPLEDTKQNRELWWFQRKRLDQRLDKFLRDLEDSWFGPSKYLFLGELSDSKYLDSLQKELGDDLKSKCKVVVDEGLSELVLHKGRYAETGCLSDKSSMVKTRTGCEFKPSSNSVNGDPIVLVLDLDVQMLPWENLPVLRNQEVYRMPSVASISSTLHRCSERQEKDKNDSSAIPLIDPLDAYYLLNPSGDLKSTEAEFGNWFRDQNLEWADSYAPPSGPKLGAFYVFSEKKGKAGSPATVEELTTALTNHDLFIYFGHGSGAQYIPGHEIQKLDNCAATFLMGCSSGSISLNGPYNPHGAPLYYLLAGSPVIVANLWEVTDKDIDRFGKAMLDAWLSERSKASMACSQCNDLADKMKAMNIDVAKGKGKKRTLKNKLPNVSCKHRPKIGSFMGQAREACTLPFLIGASPVCYGVPTGIRNKDS